MIHCHTLEAVLRQRGYRVTPQREIIVEALAHSGRHMTAEEVLEIEQQRTRFLNIATVYRMLNLLVEHRLATPADLGKGRVVYATVWHEQHIHLGCRRCRLIQEIDTTLLVPLTDAIHGQYHFRWDTGHLVLCGFCEARARVEQHREGHLLRSKSPPFPTYMHIPEEFQNCKQHRPLLGAEHYWH